MSEPGTASFSRTRRHWLLPAVGVAAMVVLPLVALYIGFELRRLSVDEHGANALASAIPWILVIGAVVIGMLSFLVIAEFHRRQERAQRLAERMTADLRRTQDELRSALAAAQDAARSKDEFLAVMSHELRTPLNGVIGMTNLLLDSGLSPQALDFADTARTCATGLLDIIDDILDYSKLGNGRVQLEAIEFDPRDLVEESLQILADRAQAKGLELVGEVDPRLGARLVGDPARLRQLLLNLVGNAVKFTDQGSVTVTMRAIDEGGRRLTRLSVADTGIGLTTEQIARIFEPFTQADGSISRRFGGTGLGLTICQRLAEAMGGTIAVASEAGAGSTFHVELPLSREGPACASSMPPELAGRLALVVDDHAAARSACAVILSECGCEVVGAATLIEGLAVLSGAVPDLIVLDAAGRGDDPAAIVGQARSRPELAEVPVVLLTTFAMQNRLELLRTALTAKPVRRRQLRESAKHIMGRRPGSGTERIPRRFVGLTTLVVDHRLGNLRLLAGILGDLGCRVDLVDDLGEAIAAVRRVRHAAVFITADLPPQGAGAVARALRAEPGPRLIVATGGSRVVPDGCDAAVTSPPRTADVARLLAQAHERR